MQHFLPETGLSALISGTIASIVTTVALGVLAKTEGKDATQPLNATSHWLHGEGAAEVREADTAHTATGYLTHHGACIMWASLMEAVLSRRENPSVSEIAVTAAVVSGLAAAVDYGITPKRFTPG